MITSSDNKALWAMHRVIQAAKDHVSIMPRERERRAQILVDAEQALEYLETRLETAEEIE